MRPSSHCASSPSRSGKTPIVAKDTAGFVVNFLLIPYMLSAVRMYENGLATMDDIDTA